ncbi:hypothetical protein ACA910_018550 [Epithemia clementina (nom. ined.)]
MLLPTVYGNTLCSRPLKEKEIALALDLPSTITKDWNDDMLRAANHALTMSVKIADYLAQRVHNFLATVLVSANLVQPGEKHLLQTVEGDDAFERGSKRPRVAGQINQELCSEQPPVMSWATLTIERMKTFLLSNYHSGSTVVEKAAKNDDAEVPVHLWDFRIAFLMGVRRLEPREQRAVATLRNLLVRRWKWSVFRSWNKWWKETYCTSKSADRELHDLLWERGVKACDHASQATFWNWQGGSGIFLWRWPPEYQSDVALGVPPYWTRQPVAKIVKQGNLGDRETIQKISAKIDDVRKKGYIAPEKCIATIKFFSVPKGDSDIRMVYDGTKSGLNECLYAPWFPLPNGDALTNTLDDGLWFIDNDYGEIFLNFRLHPSLQLFSGMDFSALYGREKGGALRTEV